MLGLSQQPEQELELPAEFGKYVLLQRIGTGGMAEVYLARRPGIGGFSKTVVVKRLRPSMRDHPGYLEMFVEEAKLAAEVQHRNVVQVFDLGSLENGEVFMAMEYVRGTDLKRVLRTATHFGRRVPVWFTLHVVSEVLEALAFAHDLQDPHGRARNIVHCDVTPENIFLSDLGDVKLGDFGVALDDSRAREPFEGQIKGKIPYMSPEQLGGKRPDRRSDVFSAGVVLWECLSQRRLFNGATPQETMAKVCTGQRPPPSAFTSDVSPQLDQCVLKALTAERDSRIGDAPEMARQLRLILDDIRPRITSSDLKEALRDLIRSEPADSTDTPQSRKVPATVSEVFDLAESDVVREEPILGGAPEVQPDPRGASYAGVPPPREPPADPPADPTDDPLDDPEDSTYSILRPTNAVDHLGDAPTKMIQAPIPAEPGAFETNDLLRTAVPREPAPRRPSESLRPPMEAPFSASPPPRLLSAVDRNPLWVRTVSRFQAEPLSPAGALEAIRGHLEHHPPSAIQVSTDTTQWVPVKDLLPLLGERWILPNPALPPGRPCGDLVRTSLASVFGVLARAGASGWLVIVNTADGAYTRRELAIIGGCLAGMDSSLDILDPLTHALHLRTKGSLELGVALHRTIQKLQPLEWGLTKNAESTLRPEVIRRIQANLRALFSNRAGTYSFLRDETIRPQLATPVSLLRLLPAVVSRAIDPDHVTHRIRPCLDVPFIRAPRFEEEVEAMGLSSEEQALISPFGHGYTLKESLGAAPDAPRENRSHFMAYLLLELGLLERYTSSTVA